MTQRQFIDSYIEELTRCLKELDREKIEEAVNILLSAYKRGKKVFIIGNGGSAATASHLACDLGKGTLRRVYESNTPKSRAQNPSDF